MTTNVQLRDQCDAVSSRLAAEGRGLKGNAEYQAAKNAYWGAVRRVTKARVNKAAGATRRASRRRRRAVCSTAADDDSDGEESVDEDSGDDSADDAGDERIDLALRAVLEYGADNSLISHDDYDEQTVDIDPTLLDAAELETAEEEARGQRLEVDDGDEDEADNDPDEDEFEPEEDENEVTPPHPA